MLPIEIPEMKVLFMGITTKIWENNRSGLSTQNENETMGGAGKEVILCRNVHIEVQGATQETEKKIL